MSKVAGRGLSAQSLHLMSPLRFAKFCSLTTHILPSHLRKDLIEILEEGQEFRGGLIEFGKITIGWSVGETCSGGLVDCNKEGKGGGQFTEKRNGQKQI